MAQIITCPFCGEDYDIADLNDAAALTPKLALEWFYRKGCGYVFEGRVCESGCDETTASAHAPDLNTEGEDPELIALLESLGVPAV